MKYLKKKIVKVFKYLSLANAGASTPEVEAVVTADSHLLHRVWTASRHDVVDGKRTLTPDDLAN